jgi:two-component system phosphate regulon response regulator PhoB
MTPPRIVVVEDQPSILELLTFNLAREGFSVAPCVSGEEGLEAARKAPPDAVLLDLMLPGIDGLEVCRRLKADPRTARVPVVMLTARGEEADIVAGLELGADDYVTKPFSPRVLVARLRSVLRRHAEGPVAGLDQPVEHRGVVVNPGRHEVLVDDTPVALTATELRLLHVLVRRPGWVFTRDQLISAVHGDDYPVTDRSIDVQVVGLRRKLGDAGALLETVRGVGYRFRE